MQYNVFGSKHWSNVQGNEENKLLNTETETDFVGVYVFLA